VIVAEKNEKRMVIKGSERGWSFILGLTAIIVWLVLSQFIPLLWLRIILSIGGALLLLAFLQSMIGKKIVIDKQAETITIGKRSFFLTSRQRIVRFSEIKNLIVNYRHIRGTSESTAGPSETWELLLDIGEKLEIERGSNRTNLLSVAGEISGFIGKELIDNSAKAGRPPANLFDQVQ